MCSAQKRGNKNGIKVYRVHDYSSNRHGLIILLPLQTIAWLLGSLAVNNLELYLFAATMHVTIALGVVILVFHTFANVEAS